MESNSDTAYRRGAALGLTVAEIFMLLVFLLLMIFLGLGQQWYEWRGIMKDNDPDEIRTLVNQAQNPQWRELQEAVSSRTDEEIETLVNNFSEWDDIMKTHTPNEIKALFRSVEKDAGAQEIMQALREDNRRLQEENQQAKRNLQIHEKGKNPPCWYEIKDRREGGQREKAHYLFDIEVYDDAMVVRPLPAPPGQSVDDAHGLTYAQEAESLNLDNIPYNSRLTNEQVREYMKPIHALGKSEQVRSYSCVFFVRVLDKTSLNAKDRWKQAHYGVLEQLFGTYVDDGKP